ncbi:hypothetical protein BC829DRAFT_116635 [Chytridium lagenaria]|nr:hypothetical protein BC829DRAFT_116635 [Chytridium lagenaria]
MILTETLILAKSKGLARASTVKDLVHIKTINLWGQNITDVSFISNLPQLQVISFAVNSITDLSPFQHLTSLRELYLRKNAITQASQLIHLLHLPITDLWVADNPFCALLKPYRAVMVRLFPGLRRLDDKDVTRVDRGEAEILDVGFSVGDMDGAKRFLRGLDGGQGGFNDDRGVSVARIERAQRGNEKRESWGDVELLAAVQNHMKARSSTVTAAVGDMDPTSFLSRGSRALQTSEMELRRLAAAIAHMEGPGDPVSVAGRRRRRSPPERSEGFFDDGFNVQEQKRGSVDEMKMKMFTVNAVDERPIRPMPTAVKTSVGEAMGFGNAWDDDEDEVYARRNHRTHPKDTSGLVIQGHPTRTRSKTGEKKSTPIVLPPSPVSVSPVSSEGTTSESSSIYPVVSVNDRVTHPIATLEDHIAGPGRLVHVEHKPPEGRIKHVMSHHETPVVVGEMEKLEKGYRLPRCTRRII